MIIMMKFLPPNHSLEAILRLCSGQAWDAVRFVFNVENLVMWKVRVEEYQGASAKIR
jgi:hypothetical protein